MICAFLSLATMTSVAAAKARVYAKVESETAIYTGDQFVYSIVVEGGGAVGIAALLSGKLPEMKGSVVVVVSGGNVDLPLLLRLAEAG
jgi:threonine dehydratase